jgi:5-methylcytosine-specific restriction protein A
MQPKLTEKSVLAAMREFDAELRDTEEWKGWEDNKAHLYAAKHDGKLYPVKKIASIASGIPVRSFSGGRRAGDANSLMEDVGFKVIPLRGGNPDWTRDELILALNVYLKHRPNPPDKASKEIIALSKTLQKLGQRLFSPSERADSFRNANGVYMKLMNFRRLDPEYTSGGKKGLSRGAKGEEEVWEEFANDPARCQAVADAIIATLDDPEAGGPESDLTDDIEEAAEGRLLTRKHLARERNRKLVETKRKQALKKLGKLECEVCKFDFATKYGSRGDGFIECHHTKPVATLTEGHKTHINDLALVCANCHRIIHRAKPWLSVEGLKKLLT